MSIARAVVVCCWLGGISLFAQTDLRLRGGVPSGTAGTDVRVLSLKDAVDLGLQRNLAIVSGNQDVKLARAQRLAVLNSLLPNVEGRVAETVQQINLAALGLPSFAGVPRIVGPFSVSDARASTSFPAFNYSSLESYRAARTVEAAARLSYTDLRDQVVTAVVQLYLQALTTQAEIDAVRAQLTTAEALYRQALDQKNAGVAIGIDVLRAQVEMQNQKQRLILNTAEAEKAKLNLARAIGLPSGQRIQLQAPDAGEPQLQPLDDYLRSSAQNRVDLKAAEARVQAAELNRSAARALWYPNLTVDANYGVIGRNPSDVHGTFAVTGGLNFPIFAGTRIKAEREGAEAELAQRRAELADLRARVDTEVRTAYLDLEAALDRLRVATENRKLAADELEQARDRFAAGVTNNLEVVQAQQSVAAAEESLIASRYGLALARLATARASGRAEEMVKETK